METVQASPPREDMLALYQQAGWEFVCLTGDFWLFSSEDPAAEPVYSDDESRVASLQHMEKRFLSSAVVTVLLLCLALFIGHETGGCPPCSCSVCLCWPFCCS